MGSGQVAISCKELGRDFIGFEIMPEICDFGNGRVEGIKGVCIDG
jgi:DNA modification methylase